MACALRAFHAKSQQQQVLQAPAMRGMPDRRNCGLQPGGGMPWHACWFSGSATTASGAPCYSGSGQEVVGLTDPNDAVGVYGCRCVAGFQDQSLQHHLCSIFLRLRPNGGVPVSRNYD